MTSNQSVVLTIAGFDPSGGAGIIADVKTIAHFGCVPAAAMTSLTLQNAAGLFGAIHESARSLRAQIVPSLEEHVVSAVKIGMLPTVELVSEVVQLIRERRLPPPVFDPVLRSSSGYELMAPDAIELVTRELMPLARLLTPNIPEAEIFSGKAINDEQDMRDAAQKLSEMGARAVLIKGGHVRLNSAGRTQKSAEKRATDLLYDDGNVFVFSGEWIDAPPLRGTGCMMSSAIASCLARGLSLPESVGRAKEYIAGLIRQRRRPFTAGEANCGS